MTDAILNHASEILRKNGISPYQLSHMIEQERDPASHLATRANDALSEHLNEALNELPRARYKLHIDPNGHEAVLWKQKIHDYKAQYKHFERFEWFLMYGTDALDLKEAADRNYLRECLDVVLSEDSRDFAQQESDFALLCAWAGYSVTLADYLPEEEPEDEAESHGER